MSIASHVQALARKDEAQKLEQRMTLQAECRALLQKFGDNPSLTPTPAEAVRLRAFVDGGIIASINDIDGHVEKYRIGKKAKELAENAAAEFDADARKAEGAMVELDSIYSQEVVLEQGIKTCRGVLHEAQQSKTAAEQALTAYREHVRQNALVCENELDPGLEKRVRSWAVTVPERKVARYTPPREKVNQQLVQQIYSGGNAPRP
jgi:hypothetical protein